MSIQWRLLTKNGMMYGLVSAVLFAGVFTILGLSEGFASDIYLGAAAGVISGFLIATIVGGVDLLLTRKKAASGILAWRGLNPVIGALAGAIITTAVFIVMVQLVGCTGHPQTLAVFGVSLCCLIGVPLGVIIGLPIGASWRLG